MARYIRPVDGSNSNEHAALRELAVHREALLRLCYRMTGSTADAEDVVQETFARALARPPAELDRDLRPWLVRVAMNLSRDALRTRKAAATRHVVAEPVRDGVRITSRPRGPLR